MSGVPATTRQLRSLVTDDRQVRISVDTVGTTHRGLDRRPTELRRGFGFAWGIGGWLLMPFLGSLSVEDLVRLKDRIAAELTSTFASHFTEEVSLDQALDLDVLRRYARTATGEKFLVVPQEVRSARPTT